MPPTPSARVAGLHQMQTLRWSQRQLAVLQPAASTAAVLLPSRRLHAPLPLAPHLDREEKPSANETTLDMPRHVVGPFVGVLEVTCGGMWQTVGLARLW
jgi:hypothetical protein